MHEYAAVFTFYIERSRFGRNIMLRHSATRFLLILNIFRIVFNAVVFFYPEEEMKIIIFPRIRVSKSLWLRLESVQLFLIKLNIYLFYFIINKFCKFYLQRIYITKYLKINLTLYFYTEFELLPLSSLPVDSFR